MQRTEANFEKHSKENENCIYSIQNMAPTFY